MRPSLRAALACVLLAPAALLADDPFAVELATELNRARAERGLGALESDAALAAVATHRAAAMASEGWFGLVSPTGEQVEDDLDAASYPFRLVTEKLVRSNAGARALVDEWRVRPNDQLQSLFHPGVTRVGVGVAESAGGRIVDVVLATPMAAAALAAPAPFDAAAERAALRDLVDGERKRSKLSRLRADPMLEEAATEHAAALLAALARGQGTESIELLADRVALRELRRSGGGGGLVRSEDSFSGREITASPSGRPLHDQICASIVLDARTAAEALALVLSETEVRPGILDPAMARLGVGIAGGTPESGNRILWVVATRKL